MDLQLQGKCAIVNGASSGIGFAIARLLAGEGVRVAMAARRIERLLEKVDQVRRETGTDPVAIQGDIRIAQDCDRIVGTAAQALGRVDILINNDGAPPLGKLVDFDDTQWDKAVQQNLMSVVRLSRAAIGHMRQAGGGSIVNIAALSALQPKPGFGLSVATWAGVLGYAKTLSLEVAQDAITVNTICPGVIETPRVAKVFGNTGASGGSAQDELNATTPLGRIGSPDEVAGLVALLVSSYGAYITGSVISVDGGRRGSLL